VTREIQAKITAADYPVATSSFQRPKRRDMRRLFEQLSQFVRHHAGPSLAPFTPCQVAAVRSE
jgi:hypothetical protein